MISVLHCGDDKFIIGPARFSDLGQFSVGKTIMKTRLPNVLNSTSASETHNIG